MLLTAIFCLQVVFLLGMFFYKQKSIASESTQNNMLFQVIGCIYRGAKYKLKNVREHTWIDGARAYYSEHFVQEVCDILKVCDFFFSKEAAVMTSTFS